MEAIPNFLMHIPETAKIHIHAMSTHYAFIYEHKIIDLGPNPVLPPPHALFVKDALNLTNKLVSSPHIFVMKRQGFCQVPWKMYCDMVQCGGYYTRGALSSPSILSLH